MAELVEQAAVVVQVEEEVVAEAVKLVKVGVAAVVVKEAKEVEEVVSLMEVVGVPRIEDEAHSEQSMPAPNSILA
jgi:hypothetical protein